MGISVDAPVLGFRLLIPSKSGYHIYIGHLTPPLFRVIVHIRHNYVMGVAKAMIKVATTIMTKSGYNYND